MVAIFLHGADHQVVVAVKAGLRGRGPLAYVAPWGADRAIRELLDAARKARARARGAELGGRAWREAPRSRARHLSWLELRIAVRELNLAAWGLGRAHKERMLLGQS